MTNERDAALLGPLRRRGDEAQLTRTLNALPMSEPGCASAFVELLLTNAPSPVAATPPPELFSRAEEVVQEGRLDLRFTDSDQWDVIVELKLYASYGREQLDRYLASLKEAPHAYLVAVTRDVPIYGEAHLDQEQRWLGSVRWRRLLPGLRKLPIASTSLASQWQLFLDVLETEGSMGFTRPDTDLFSAWSSIRPATKHAEDFLNALQQPLIEALGQALARHGLTADFYRAQRGRGRPVISKRWSGIIDLQFRIPADGPVSLRAGLFAYNPPTRFYVAPHYGRRLGARRQHLPPELRKSIQNLTTGAFREYDLHAFYELSGDVLSSPVLEETIVEWAHERFVELAASGLLDAQHLLKGASFAVSEEENSTDEA